MVRNSKLLVGVAHNHHYNGMDSQAGVVLLTIITMVRIRKLVLLKIITWCYSKLFIMSRTGPAKSYYNEY